jgi:hypothetical protein
LTNDRRFLEESFAALIGIIFIYEAFDKMIDINRQRPVRLHTDMFLPANCSCKTRNQTKPWKSPMTINVLLTYDKHERTYRERLFRFVVPLGVLQEASLSILRFIVQFYS